MRHSVAAMVVAAWLLAALTCSAHADNLLDNPAFERGPWPQSPAWHGEMTVVDEPTLLGEKAGMLTVGPDAHATIYSGYVPCTAGLNYRFSIYARGSGTLSLRSIQLRDDPEDRYIIERPHERLELDDDWRPITIELAPTDAKVIRIAAVVHLEGEGATAYLDNAILTVMGLPGAAIEVEPSYAMVTPGESVQFSLAASSDAGPITDGTVRVNVVMGEQTHQAEIVITGETTAFTLAAPEADDPGLARVSFVSGALGIAQNAWIDVVAPETLAEFEAAARAARIDTPAHILFLGDSLSDQRRGHNYTDMLGYWLAREHGEVSYRNAAVGGDYITRMWARMQGENVHRAYRYDDLFEPTPTRVFIWTGHNDSKLRPNPEYRSPEDYEFDPVVPLDDFEETFVTVIEHVRSHAPAAQITIVSASASIYELRRDAVAARIADGQSGGNLFGRPDVLEAFNERMQSVAERVGADYVDVYEPTRTHPDRASIFTGDGVHMTHEGNLLIARLLLGYLGE